MEEAASDQVHRMLSSWMFDLHRAGRSVTAETQREVLQIASLVVGAGGTMREAFSAARSILQHPAGLEDARA